ncbi:Thiol:disulfide interchange protein DsbD precursor [Legionella massiliensis]|uniref:Thiol:disulfide interchange protein DsbD n=1 Tax=Legionella massiliensis TaxID=1034943 RepID=A0A078L1Z5_9GAMM|nr:protein-disulfide reductase DsbD [Legionella massiliensis]CDZ78043.1 Thiol:disulfide interchange protein DsbD precursor [Legionella massiliensis]CEE13781.1 Thiol:disulfide interchange protein DsbD precursor [Legionella massiliensis]
MKNVTRLAAVFALMFISHMAWSFSLNFESSNPEMIMSFIQQNNAFVYLSAFFAIGLLLAFTPCVLPMVPILSGIIAGQDSLSTHKAVKLSLGYVAGMAVTYAAAGMLAGFMGSTIQTQMQRPSVIIAFSLLFLLMALSMFGLFELRLPAKLNLGLNHFSKKSNKHSFLSVALMGVISTLVVSPCVTAPLIGVLTYIGQNGQALRGGLILFVMAIGMGVPLVLVSAGYGSVLPKTGAWMIKIKQLFGLMMIGIAIWMLGRILPSLATNLLWVVLLFITSLNLGLLRSAMNKSERVLQLFGLLALILGTVVAYHSLAPEFRSKTEELAASHAPFIEVNTLEAVKEQLALAKTDSKPVFLEFSASWCSDCQNMDSQVFNQAEISKAMSGLVSVKVDISENNQEVAAIKKYFSIYGTPTMLFFDAQGQLQNQLTAVGYIDKSTMLKLLQRAG